MQRLPPSVRRKAIAIANALLAAGHPEGQSIRIGITVIDFVAMAATAPAERAGQRGGERESHLANL